LGPRRIDAPGPSFGSWQKLKPHGFTPISLSETLEGGQSFTWHKVEDLNWLGVIGGRLLEIRLKDTSFEWRSNSQIPITRQEVKDYFWIDSSYEEAVNSLPWRSDPILKHCIESLSGLRILRQPIDEILFYFLLSPVKSIPQIKETGQLVAQKYGKNLGAGFFGFPGWEILSEVTEKDLRSLKLGYRAKSIVGTARFLKTRSDWLEEVVKHPYLIALEKLKELPGVGSKIAACTLLFGGRKLNAFPIDTWIEKVMSNRYGLNGWDQKQMSTFASCHFGEFAGLAQQFFFSAERLGFLNEFD